MKGRLPRVLGFYVYLDTQNNEKLASFYSAQIEETWFD